MDENFPSSTTSGCHQEVEALAEGPSGNPVDLASQSHGAGKFQRAPVS